MAMATPPRRVSNGATPQRSSTLAGGYSPGKRPIRSHRIHHGRRARRETWNSQLDRRCAQTRWRSRPRAQISSCPKPRAAAAAVLSPSTWPVAVSTAAMVCERLCASAPSTIMIAVHVLSNSDAGQPGGQGLLGAVPRSYQVTPGHPRPATSDTTKGSHTQRADSLNDSQLAARSGPSPPRRTSPTAESKQQAFMRHSSLEGAPPAVESRERTLVAPSPSTVSLRLQ